MAVNEIADATLAAIDRPPPDRKHRARELGNKRVRISGSYRIQRAINEFADLAGRVRPALLGRELVAPVVLHPPDNIAGQHRAVFGFPAEQWHDTFSF